MKSGQILNTIKDLKFYLIAALAGLCFSMGFGGYNFPLPRLISKLSTPLLIMSVVIAIVVILLNFNNVFKLYKNNRLMMLFILLLVVVLVVFAKIHWVIVPLVIMLAFYPSGHRLASRYLFFWSLLFFFVIIFLGLAFPDLSRESVGKVESFFGSASGLSASCLGFANPNQPLFYLMVIAINGSFVFARSCFRRTYAITMALLATIIYFLTLSRTSYLAVMIFILLYFLGSKNIYKFLKKSMVAMVIVFTAVSFFVAINYGIFGNPINNTLTNRPYYWNLRVEDGIINNIYGNKDRYEESNGPESALDNNYINLIARYGWVVFFVIFYLFVFERKKANKTDDDVYVLGLFVILVYFLSESMPFSMVLCIIPTISMQRKFLNNGEVIHV